MDIEHLYAFNVLFAMPCLCLWPLVFYHGVEKIKNNVFPIKECGTLSVMGLSVFWMINWLNRDVPRVEPLRLFEIFIQVFTAIAICSSSWIIFLMLRNKKNSKYPCSELAVLVLYGFIIYMWLIVLH